MEKGVNHAYIKIKYKHFGFQTRKRQEEKESQPKDSRLIYDIVSCEYLSLVFGFAFSIQSKKFN